MSCSDDEIEIDVETKQAILCRIRNQTYRLRKKKKPESYAIDYKNIKNPFDKFMSIITAKRKVQTMIQQETSLY